MHLCKNFDNFLFITRGSEFLEMIFQIDLSFHISQVSEFYSGPETKVTLKKTKQRNIIIIIFIIITIIIIIIIIIMIVPLRCQNSTFLTFAKRTRGSTTAG